MKKVIFALFFTLCLVFAVSAQQAKEQAIAIGAGEYWVYGFEVTSTANFAGRFRARGGARNDVEVYILDSDGYENFRNGNSAETYYNSGRKTVGNFNVRLGKGQYYLVINNRFSTFSSKAVELTLYQ